MILIDGVEVDFGRFPNKEGNLNFNNISFYTTSELTFKYESDMDLFNLYILKKYIDDVIVNNEITLKIVYMPYSRMDRQNKDYTFNLKYVCELINSMKFARVKVQDAHSDVTLALIDRCESYSRIPMLFSEFFDYAHDLGDFIDTELVVFYPDAGAEKRYSKDFSYPSLVALKERNFTDGSITKYNVCGDLKEGSVVVIVDDLCSKGGTFVAAATELKKLGAGKIYLIVSHCEDNIYNGSILYSDLIEKVFTTNSILSDNLKDHPKLQVIGAYSKFSRSQFKKGPNYI